MHSNIEEKEVEKIRYKLPNIKLVRLIQISQSGELCTNLKYVDYYLLDNYNLKTNRVGGTGLIHDWKKSK